MHQQPVITLLFAFFFTAISVGDEYEPQAVHASDFSGLIEQSPFNRTLNVSGSLIITGIAEIDEQQVATLLDTESKETYVVSAIPNKQGWKMLEVTPNEDLERVTAKISVAGEIVNIRYAENKLKPGDTRPGGGSPRTEAKNAPPQRKGPSDDFRKKVGSLNDEQKAKFFSKMKEMHQKHPELSSEERSNAARKVLEKISSKGK